MSQETISDRLKLIASYVKKESKVADIGSDHALLPTYLIMNNIAEFCVAGEVNQGPFEAAKAQVKKTELEHKIDVRLGDGLAVLKQNEVDTICIAGMGGSLITKILQSGIERVQEVNRLVLQPNIGSEHIRRFFIEHDWEIIEENILEEDDKIYEVVVAEKGDGLIPYNNLSLSEEWATRIGPLLWRKPTSTLLKKWEIELDKLNKIIESLGNSTDPEAIERRKQFQLELSQLEEILTCMRMEIK